MKKLAIGLILLASVNTNAQTVLPTYAPNQPLTAVAYNDENTGAMTQKMTVFLSDGSYCIAMAGVGDLAFIQGKWHRQGDQVTTTLYSASPIITGEWRITNGITTGVLIDNWLIESFNEPFLVGFGNKTPTKLDIYDPKKGTSTLPIPKGATHFFVGAYKQGATKHTLIRFSLDYNQLPPPEEGTTYNLEVIGYPNEFKNQDVNIQYNIQNGQLFKVMLVDDIDYTQTLSNPLVLSDKDKAQSLYRACTLDPASESDNQKYAFAQKDMIEWQGKVAP